MPVIAEARSTLKKFYLPTTAWQRDGEGALMLDADKKPIPLPQEDQVYVTIDMRALTASDILNTYGDDDNGNMRSAKLLFTRVKEWNITEPDGSARPVTFENFCRLPVTDFMYLIGQDLGPAPKGLDSDQKKS
jgi:hypothetical protein